MKFGGCGIILLKAIKPMKYTNNTIFCFVFGLGFGGAMVLMSACFLKAFGSQNLGSVRGVSALLIVPVQPVGMVLVGTAFDLNLYLESFLLMGAITLIGFAIGSRIIIR